MGNFNDDIILEYVRTHAYIQQNADAVSSCSTYERERQ